MTEYTFPVSGMVQLNARFGFGSLIVRAEDDVREAKVTLVAREADSDVLARCTVELRGNTLHVHGPRPRGGLFELPVFGLRRPQDALDIEAVVPTGSEVKVASVAADVTVHGRTGTTDIVVGASTIDLDQIEGDARIRFGSGPISIKAVRGAASVRAGASDVSIGESGGDLDVAFGSGTLRVQTAHGSVRMRTGAGSARINSAEANVDLTSGSGQLAIGLPAGREARLDVLTGSGRLNTEMPIETAPSMSGKPANIRARTGSGDVTITRAAS